MKSGIKSKRRVRDFGEVFTAEREVKAMCDLLPDEMWEAGHTFLEPCCGTGNFLVEILRRKLDRCKTMEAAQKAAQDIYGIDVQVDNVDEAKTRMQKLVKQRFPKADVSGILDKNIICGDSLKIMDMWKED